MTPKVLLQKALEQTGHCIERVKQKDLHKLTPCSEWDLRELLNHMVYELLWVPDLLDGKTVSEVGEQHDGDVLGGDFQAAWHGAATRALAAASRAEDTATVHLSYGDKPAGEYLIEIASDITIHGWDVGKSLNCTVIMETGIAQAVYDKAKPRHGEFKKSGLFGQPYLLDKEAGLQAQLLALYGRTDKWTSNEFISETTNHDQSRH